MYQFDDSGLAAQPVPGSHVAPHNRIDYRTHAGLLIFTNVAGLEGFYERWATGYIKRLRSLDIGDEWIEMPDFMAFFSEIFGSALIESICGPALLRLNPRFCRGFLQIRSGNAGSPQRSTKMDDLAVLSSQGQTPLLHQAMARFCECAL